MCRGHAHFSACLAWYSKAGACIQLLWKPYCIMQESSIALLKLSPECAWFSLCR